MIDEPTSPNTYRRLLAEPELDPVLRRRHVVLFGRADAARGRPRLLPGEPARRRDARLSPDRGRSPPPSGPPTPMTWIDRIFRNRSLLEPQPHTTRRAPLAAGPGDAAIASETGHVARPGPLPAGDPGGADRAGPSPRRHAAYRLLSEAYRILMLQETALLAGIKLTPENAERDRPARAPARPPDEPVPPARHGPELRDPDHARPANDAERQAAVHAELRALPALPERQLPRPRPRPAPGDARRRPARRSTAEALAGLKQQLAELNEQVKQIQDQINDLTTEQQLGPLQRASFALSQGLPGLALLELEEAERTGRQPGPGPAAAGRPLLRHRPAREGARAAQHRQRRRPVARHRARRRGDAAGPGLLPARQLRIRRAALGGPGDPPAPLRRAGRALAAGRGPASGTGQAGDHDLPRASRARSRRRRPGNTTWPSAGSKRASPTWPPTAFTKALTLAPDLPSARSPPITSRSSASPSRRRRRRLRKR